MQGARQYVRGGQLRKSTKVTHVFGGGESHAVDDRVRWQRPAPTRYATANKCGHGMPRIGFRPRRRSIPRRGRAQCAGSEFGDGLPAHAATDGHRPLDAQLIKGVPDPERIAQRHLIDL